MFSAAAAPNTADNASPAGVARANPPLAWSSSTPGVASACSPKNSAAARKPSPTNSSRASPWWRAARSTVSASHAESAAATATSQKWLGWCSHTTSAGGTASRSHSPASGSARWNAQMTTRARLPRRTAAVAVAVIVVGAFTTVPRGGAARRGRARSSCGGRWRAGRCSRSVRSALATASRDAPTQPASSSCDSATVIRVPCASGSPKRSASSTIRWATRAEVS